jgi:hypothetical protein
MASMHGRPCQKICPLTELLCSIILMTFMEMQRSQQGTGRLLKVCYVFSYAQKAYNLNAMFVS